MMWDLSAVVLRFEELEFDNDEPGRISFLLFIQTNSRICFTQWFMKLRMTMTFISEASKS